MSGFGRFVRSKWFAALFFLTLLFATWFVYGEICDAFRLAGKRAPGWWLFAVLIGIFALYEVVRHTSAESCAKKWILYAGGLYVTFFLYNALGLLAFQCLACFMEWIVPSGLWDQTAFYLAGGLALALTLCGFWHARTVVPVHYVAEVGGGGHTYRIVLLSDIHLGIYNKAGHLERIVDVVNTFKPDLVVIAGDLFDGCGAGTYFDQEAAAVRFRRIQSKDGVVFSSGNHDPATTDAAFRSFLQKANVTLLHDSGQILGQPVIFGRNDATSVREPDRRRPLQTVISGYAHHHPMIVIDHNPQGAYEAAACGADLVLCGHTHRGQMVPLNLFTKWAYGKKLFWGHHQLGRTHVVISAGCGVFQLPARIGTDNEVVAVDLVY